jgi:dihydrofolate reductase
MSKVVLTMSMSLDGFAAGPNVSVAHPMGEGGMRLHDWLLNPPVSDIDRQVVQEVFATTGAVVLGKRTFDVGLGEWGDTPYPAPSFVLTHTPQPEQVEKSGTFTFVTDGIEQAVQRARAAAGEKNVILMGVNTAQQAVKAGLVDEIQINLVPVLLGGGGRLFDHLGVAPVELERTKVVEAPGVTHLTFRVVKS